MAEEVRFAVCCPGPSLLRSFPGPVGYRAVVAVNRAALAVPCSWWAATDYPVIRKHYEQIPGTPSLLTRRQTYLDIRHRLGRFPEVALVECIEMPPDAPPWQLKTMTCAIAFAFASGARRVDVWGCDWTGTADYDGAQAGEDRTDARWARERADFDALAAWMGRRGCEVRRL